LHHLLTVISMR